MQDLFEPDRPTGAEQYARVAVERGIDNGPGGEGFAYRVEAGQVAVGERVEVPLGRGNKQAAGIVISVGGDELLDGFPAAKVKSILRSTGVCLPEALIDLAKWMSLYYVCPLGMVLATMMPAAVKKTVGRRRVVVVERAHEADEPPGDVKLSPSAKVAWEKLVAKRPASMTAKELATALGLDSVGPINRLIKAGLLRETEQDRIRSKSAVWNDVEASGSSGPVTPTPRQQEVVAGIGEALGTFSVHVLRGVTGSGKTEVYLRLIEQVLAKGDSALVLVPEIALTPQTAGRFLSKFGHIGVAVLHSGLTSSQRHSEWARVSSGEARVVVGARSAVFAPFERLGLIVVDEEHDSSYKQDQLPRYSARDVAIKRGQLEGCPIVLGSATPSLESWSNARAGRFKLWNMPDRVGGGRLPRVVIVDMAQEAKTRASGPQASGRLHFLGPTLEAAISRTLRGDGQIILLLNRRGYANYISCPDANCGWVLFCDQCDSTMVLHRSSDFARGELVRCHHCQGEQLVPRTCPTCQKKTNTFGMGTQRIEEEIGRKFAHAGLTEGETMLRVDSDSMQTARDYFDALSRFGSGQVRLLVGTQMIAKGLDYPNVRLVGVINADTSIHLPDFRASERTFQLVSQVAGRTGRGAEAGQVIVQTLNPRNPAIVLASKHDYETFADRELDFRRASGLPPVTRMARIVIRDKDHAKAAASAEHLANKLQSDFGRDVRIEGPMPCPISRIAGQYRFAVELLSDSAAKLQGSLSAMRAAGLVKSDASTAVDVDPVALM